MYKLLDRITSYLYSKENYDDNTKDVIKYGIEILILKIIFWIAAILIGFFMGLIFENLIYMVFFVILRSYAGGYHAGSRIKCFIQSMVTILLSLVVLKISNVYNVTLLIVGLFVISIVIVFLLSPIDSENKELDDNEIKCFRKKARIILLIETSIAIVTYITGLTSISISILLAVITTGALVIAGYIKNKKL